MIRQWFTILCIFGCVFLNTYPRIIIELPNHIPSKEFGDYFLKCQAASFLIMAIGATSKKNEGYVIILWQWVVGLAGNNFYDEVFGDPYHVGIAEITFSILITLWTAYRLTKWRINLTLKP